MSRKLTWPLLLCLSMTAACARQTPTVVTSVAAPADGCVAFKRLTFSRLHDTDETIAGVKQYDARRDAVCGAGK